MQDFSTTTHEELHKLVKQVRKYVQNGDPTELKSLGDSEQVEEICFEILDEAFNRDLITTKEYDLLDEKLS